MVWNSDLAYIIGLIATDGNLSKDGRHIDLTSKDIDQLKTFAKILKLKNKIGVKRSSYVPNAQYFRIEFGNVLLYRFFLKIGLTPNKTKTIGKLIIPNRYFADFLRGHLDGDGYTNSYWDKRWKNSFRLYLNFLSASKKHIEWLRGEIIELYQIEGTVRYAGKSTFRLQYSKRESIKLINKMYYRENLPCLQRKRTKIIKSFENVIFQMEKGSGNKYNIRKHLLIESGV